MRPTRAGVILVAALGLVAAACSNSDDSTSQEIPVETTSSSPTSPSTTGVLPPSTAAPSPAADPAEPVALGGEVAGDLRFAVADGYTAMAIGEGTKPDLALAPDGTPGVAYLVENLSGYIAYTEATSGWDSERIVDGYFYGPIGLAYGLDGAPRVAYHDHQDTTFQADKGDLTVAVRTNAEWAVEEVAHDGHDGWDSTIAIGADGVVRAAGIDPEQFGSTEGVEYYELRDDGWEITQIGSGPVAYEFNVSLAVDPSGNPAVTYYDTTTRELKYGIRSDGLWSIETVDGDGDVGRYSSLAFDRSGTPHISYLRLDTLSEGTVRYATREGGAWTSTDVDTLTDLRTGFTGARRVTAIALDSGQRPLIVYSDESVVKRAVPDTGNWTASTLVAAGDRELGQLVSFAIAEDGTLHLTIFEVTSASPLSGIVAYITTE